MKKSRLATKDIFTDGKVGEKRSLDEIIASVGKNFEGE